jgi:hypothetical protein
LGLLRAFLLLFLLPRVRHLLLTLPLHLLLLLLPL